MPRCCFLFLSVSFEISETPKQLVQKRHQIANAINVTNILLLCRENIFCNNLLGPIFQELNHDTNQLLKIELNQKNLSSLFVPQTNTCGKKRQLYSGPSYTRPLQGCYGILFSLRNKQKKKKMRKSNKKKKNV